LANALAEDMSLHPEEAQAVEAHEGPVPKWMADELDRRERDDVGTEEDVEAVMACLPAAHRWQRRSA
jgi:hypothetical protein